MKKSIDHPKYGEVKAPKTFRFYRDMREKLKQFSIDNEITENLLIESLINYFEETLCSDEEFKQFLEQEKIKSRKVS